MNAQAFGRDIHRKFSKVGLEEMTPEGQIRVKERATLDHADREAMRRWLARVPKGTPVALEAAFGLARGEYEGSPVAASPQARPAAKNITAWTAYTRSQFNRRSRRR
jgi:hypothetical protein